MRPFARVSVAVAFSLASATLSAHRDHAQQPPIRTEATFVRVDVYPTKDGPVDDSAAAVSNALAGLSRVRPDAQLHLRATAAPSDSGTDVWVTGELPRASGRDPWSAGGHAEIRVSSDTATGAARVDLARGERAFVSKIRLSGMVAGPLDVRVTITPAGADAIPVSESLRLDITGRADPLVYRAGPSTAGRVVPAADLRFRRAERVRLEVRLAGGVRHGSGRVLDAAGKRVPVPVKVSATTDPATGERWMLADLALAALAPADYVIELVTHAETAEHRLLTPIRVTR